MLTFFVLVAGDRAPGRVYFSFVANFFRRQFGLFRIAGDSREAGWS